MPARPALCYLDAVIRVPASDAVLHHPQGVFEGSQLCVCVCVWGAPTCPDKPSLCALSRFHLWRRLKWLLSGEEEQPAVMMLVWPGRRSPAKLAPVAELFLEPECVSAFLSLQQRRGTNSRRQNE